MAIREIRVEDDEILRKKSKDVKEINEKIEQNVIEAEVNNNTIRRYGGNDV